MSEIPLHPNEVDWREAYLESQAELYRVTAENERLREALERLSDVECNSRYGPGCDQACKSIAYRALVECSVLSNTETGKEGNG